MKKGRILSCVLVTIILLTSCIKKNPICNNIFYQLETAQRCEDVLISLTDFTEFEWDQVVVYNWPINASELCEKTGIDYEGEFDLTDGMIFVKQNKVIHEETFDNSGLEDEYCFLVIFPSEEGYNGTNLAVFDKDQAIFNVKKGTADNGKSVYWLYPVAMTDTQ